MNFQTSHIFIVLLIEFSLVILNCCSFSVIIQSFWNSEDYSELQASIKCSRFTLNQKAKLWKIFKSSVLFGVCFWCHAMCLVVPDPLQLRDRSLPGSSVRRIFQESVAISYSKGSSQPRDAKLTSPVLHWRWDSYPLSHGGKFAFGIFVKSNLKQ